VTDLVVLETGLTRDVLLRCVFSVHEARFTNSFIAGISVLINRCKNDTSVWVHLETTVGLGLLQAWNCFQVAWYAYSCTELMLARRAHFHD